MNYAQEIQQRGFAIVPQVLDAGAIDELLGALTSIPSSNAIKQRAGRAFGIRRLLEIVPAVRTLAESAAMRALVAPVLGDKLQIIRGIYFDKNPVANWKVPWHQDVMIAVREKKEVAGFSAWSTKAGVVHVQPLPEILANILAVRIHLDDTDETNGALRVIAGSHQHSILSDEQMQAFKDTGEIVVCQAKRGDALLLRPLLLHASSVATAPTHRRVLHLEFSATKLPAGLAWYGS